MNAILVRLGGETAVSVYGVLMFVDGFVQPLLYGMCDSLQPAVGYNWGAGKFSRVRAIEKCCFVASGVVSLASAAAITLFPEEITGLFIADAGAQTTALSVSALYLFSITYVTRWFSFAAQSYMLAVEKPVAASLISVSTALFFPVAVGTGFAFFITAGVFLSGLSQVMLFVREDKEKRSGWMLANGILLVAAAGLTLLGR